MRDLIYDVSYCSRAVFVRYRWYAPTENDVSIHHFVLLNYEFH